MQGLLHQPRTAEARGTNPRALAISPEREVQDRLFPWFPATANLSHGIAGAANTRRCFGTAERKNDSELRGRSPKSDDAIHMGNKGQRQTCI